MIVDAGQSHMHMPVCLWIKSNQSLVQKWMEQGAVLVIPKVIAMNLERKKVTSSSCNCKPLFILVLKSQHFIVTNGSLKDGIPGV